MSRPVAVLAEDEPLIRFDLADMLDALGFEVLQASHAGAALGHLEACDGAALLYTDIDMPGEFDGSVLAHTVADRWPSTAIIVCSACSRTVAAKLPGGAYFIAKPCAEPAVRDALTALHLH